MLASHLSPGVASWGGRLGWIGVDDDGWHAGWRNLPSMRRQAWDQSTRLQTYYEYYVVQLTLVRLCFGLDFDQAWQVHSSSSVAYRTFLCSPDEGRPYKAASQQASNGTEIPSSFPLPPYGQTGICCFGQERESGVAAGSPPSKCNSALSVHPAHHIQHTPKRRLACTILASVLLTRMLLDAGPCMCVCSGTPPQSTS